MLFGCWLLHYYSYFIFLMGASMFARSVLILLHWLVLFNVRVSSAVPSKNSSMLQILSFMVIKRQ